MGSINKTILHNFPRFRTDWNEISAIVLSHGHYDHAGALLPVISKITNPVKVYTHSHAQHTRYFKREPLIKMENLSGKTTDELEPLVRSEAIAMFQGISLQKIQSAGARVIFTQAPTVLYQDENYTIKTTGEIHRIHIEEEFSGFLHLVNGKTENDSIWDDQAIVIDQKNGDSILLLGCCHSGLMNTIDAAIDLVSKPVKYIIGGTHMVTALPERIEVTISYLKGLTGKKFIFPIHCTGPEFLELLKKEADPSLIAYDASVGTQFFF